MNPLRLLQSLLNRLLPFTRPGTPLLQDLVHTLALCAFLYFAPTIFESRSAHQHQQPPPESDAGGGLAHHDDATAPQPDHRGPVPRADELPAAEHEAADEDDDAAFDEAEQFEEDDDPDGDAAAFVDGEAAAAGGRRAAAANRQVGAKKARSIARRDQRRAYHEFVRAQAEAARAREAEGAEEREAGLFEEKRRRAVAEAVLEERARREREEKRERERRAREEEAGRQREALRLVRSGLEGRGAVEVREVVERVGRGGEDGRAWLERLLRADGVVGRGVGRDGCVRMITAGGWVVRVEESDMQMAWKRAAKLQAAKITYAHLGEALEEVLRHRA
ncbi:hypothetical protein SLS56_000357 [Neofusicoccum ribis]|uniref:Uncharacterized protein n=1 Tax=Neofusicoccum ribis TaxID=45134 RepID=A0ABR3TE59_9PEZI